MYPSATKSFCAIPACGWWFQFLSAPTMSSNSTFASTWFFQSCIGIVLNRAASTNSWIACFPSWLCFTWPVDPIQSHFRLLWFCMLLGRISGNIVCFDFICAFICCFAWWDSTGVACTATTRIKPSGGFIYACTCCTLVIYGLEWNSPRSNTFE